MAPAAAGESGPAPLIRLDKVRRDYRVGDETISALRGIDLSIEAGEMVAIVGPSGSGKSTLMNILGCLDRPSAGSYRVGGVETRELGPDALADLRREHFGFVFQRYQLLPDLTALQNVEVPAIYAGTARAERHLRSTALLGQLGLADRTGHRPAQLSGGQQQRVSIARALMNGGDVILADEPTGALDTRSGAEMLAILESLHRAGHTVIVVTHDMDVAAHARRIVELRDGEIVADRRQAGHATEAIGPATRPARPERPRGLDAWRGRFGEAFRMALLAMGLHRLRTLLTMLGIVIGIASVVSVVAVGEASRRIVLRNISAIGTNTIEVFAGGGPGDLRAEAVRTLAAADADALAGERYVDSVTPNVSGAYTVRVRNVAVNATSSGVGDQYFRVKDIALVAGRTFDATDVRERAQVAVIDENARARLFEPGQDPIGAVILLGTVPLRVIGLVSQRKGFGSGRDGLEIYLPYTTAMSRFPGQASLRSLTVRVSDHTPMAAAEQGIAQLLERRHGRKDFHLFNIDTVRQTIDSTTRALTLLISSIAVISLVVGGIGVMNIMLVSVSERTGEIGVRIAVGARQGDIQQQFLIEAVLVCLIGGAIGLLLAALFAEVFSRFSSTFKLAVSPASMIAATVCSTLIGVVFGFVPARNAARLDPVVALARD